MFRIVHPYEHAFVYYVTIDRRDLYFKGRLIPPILANIMKIYSDLEVILSLGRLIRVNIRYFTGLVRKMANEI